MTYTYNTLHQLTEESWSEGGVSKINYYDYDLAGRRISKEEVAGGVRSAAVTTGTSTDIWPRSPSWTREVGDREGNY